jgi:hypothetical protein
MLILLYFYVQRVLDLYFDEQVSLEERFIDISTAHIDRIERQRAFWLGGDRRRPLSEPEPEPGPGESEPAAPPASGVAPVPGAASAAPGGTAPSGTPASAAPGGTAPSGTAPAAPTAAPPAG